MFHLNKQLKKEEESVNWLIYIYIYIYIICI